MSEIATPPDDFPTAFETAFARVQILLEEASAEELEWPLKVAAAVRAGLSFAAAHPQSVRTLTAEPVLHGADGVARYERLIAYLAEALATGRTRAGPGDELPPTFERGLAGGVATLIALRVEGGREAELPGIASQVIQFILTGYVGPAEALRISIAPTSGKLTHDWHG
ncbi:MAG TPA: hypothetical protein VGO66_07945 [Solirubrobacterales bacterium]|jgi:hypothetical protein|nr:hypothetical protein [Solirubrobacterales bacterium]